MAKRITIKRGASTGAHKDYYVVAGGPFKPVLTLSKSEAKKIAAARRKVVAARKKRK
jgi:hypothetical protein